MQKFFSLSSQVTSDASDNKAQNMGIINIKMIKN